MKIGNYAVSLQYGNFIHHWVHTDIDTVVRARTIADNALATAIVIWTKASRKRGGAKPKVHIWTHHSSSEAGQTSVDPCQSAFNL